MRCDDVRVQLAAYIDGVLERGEQARVEAHLLACGRCAGELEALRQTVAFVAMLDEVEVPQDFRPKLRQRLHEVQREVQRTQRVAPLPAPAGRRWSPSRWVTPAVAAAALFLGVVLFPGASQPVPPSEARPPADLVALPLVAAPGPSEGGGVVIPEFTLTPASPGPSPAPATSPQPTAESARATPAPAVAAPAPAAAAPAPAPAAKAAEPPTVASRPVPGTPDVRVAQVQPASPEGDKYLMLRSEIVLEAANLLKAVEQVEMVNGEFSGVIDWRYAADGRTAIATLKVTPANFEKVVAALAGLGKAAKQVTMQDVTAQYLELQAREKLLQERIAQLSASAGPAVQAELDLAQQELEAVTLQLRFYRQPATISVTLRNLG